MMWPQFIRCNCLFNCDCVSNIKELSLILFGILLSIDRNFLQNRTIPWTNISYWFCTQNRFDFIQIALTHAHTEHKPTRTSQCAQQMLEWFFSPLNETLRKVYAMNQILVIRTKELLFGFMLWRYKNVWSPKAIQLNRSNATNIHLL